MLRFRFGRHQLDAAPASSTAGSVQLLDYGVQDTGPDGAAWALGARGAQVDGPSGDPALALAWTLRGAPHAYRRSDLAAVAVATSPLSEVDARKRIFDAWTPLRAAGIDAVDALRTVAGHLRAIVDRPMAKGDVSSRLTDLVGEPFLRACRPCATTHVYENPFRLAALQAGLELEPGTSPPVLRRVRGLRPSMFAHSGGEALPQFHAVRNYLRFYGPARMADVAAFLDAPLAEVKAHWPADAREVRLAGEASRAGRTQPRFALAADLDELAAAATAPPPGAARLLGPYDPYLQLRDREVLVGDEERRRALWPVLGRPGAIVHDGEIVATWRPRSSGRRLTVTVEWWEPAGAGLAALVAEQAERLAAHRGVTLAAVVDG